MFKVFDNGELADHHFHNVDQSWTHPFCLTFHQAQEYCRNWLGIYAFFCPEKPNHPVDYSGCGDVIEIRQTNPFDDAKVGDIYQIGSCAFQITETINGAIYGRMIAEKGIMTGGHTNYQLQPHLYGWIKIS